MDCWLKMEEDEKGEDVLGGRERERRIDTVDLSIKDKSYFVRTTDYLMIRKYNTSQPCCIPEALA